MVTAKSVQATCHFVMVRTKKWDSQLGNVPCATYTDEGILFAWAAPGECQSARGVTCMPVEMPDLDGRNVPEG